MDQKLELAVLQPDLLVLKEGDRVHRRSPKGAVPVLVIEVLSQATASLDRDTKAGLYLKTGVREVWIFHGISVLDIHAESRIFLT